MPSQAPTSAGTAYYSENDRAPALRRQLLNGDGTAISLAAANTVTITIAHSRYDHYYSPYTPIVDRSACNIEAPATGGWVNWVPGAGDLSPPGAYQFIFEINWNDGTRQTVPAHTYETMFIRTKPGGVDQA